MQHQITNSQNQCLCASSTAPWLNGFISLCLSSIDSQVISQLRVLSRSVATGSKFDRELWSNGLSPILNLWKKLNQVSSFFFCLPFPLFIFLSLNNFIFSNNQIFLLCFFSSNHTETVPLIVMFSVLFDQLVSSYLVRALALKCMA